MNTRLEKFYKDEVVPKLKKQFGYTNVMQVPRITKITVNMGVGEAVADRKIIENAVADLAKITGQKPLVTQVEEVDRDRSRCARLADRLQGDAAPREACTSSSIAWSTSRCRASATSAACQRASFDGRGNYSLGIKEQIIFPEIQYDQIDAIRGMDITITTTREDRRRSQGPARSLQFPVPQVRTQRRTMAKTTMVEREKRGEARRRSTRRSARAEGDHLAARRRRPRSKWTRR